MINNVKKTIFIVVLLSSFSILSQGKYQKNYYKNGQLESEGWIKNNLKTSYWKFYYSNGNCKKEGHFKNDKPVKYWYFYQENLMIGKEGHFIDGKKNNWWIFYNKTGEIDYKCQLKDNQKNGYYLRYHNKKLVKAEKYHKGKKIDEWTDLYSFRKENNLLDLK